MQAPTGIVLFFLFGATFCLPLPQDAVVLEAEPDFVVVEAAQEDRQGRVLVETPSIPFDDSNFRLSLPGRVDEELAAVIVDAGDVDPTRDSDPGFADIPRDRSGPNQAGFRLPLPEDDAVIVEGRDQPDIPTDTSLPEVAGFRLPLSDADNDDIIFDAEIPIDNSREGKAGFRLPRPSGATGRAISNSEPVDFVVVEAAADDEVEEGRALSDIPRDHSGLKKAGFRLPLPDDQIIPDSEFEAVVVEVEPSDRESKSIKDIIPRYVIIPGPW